MLVSVELYLKLFQYFFAFSDMRYGEKICYRPNGKYQKFNNLYKCFTVLETVK